jgi:hypothetical protein
MKFATLVLPILSAGLFGFTTPARAALECRTYRGGQVCVSSYGTYSVYFRDGAQIQGQCSSGVRFTTGIPFAVLNEFHRAICNIDLDLGI